MYVEKNLDKRNANNSRSNKNSNMFIIFIYERNARELTRRWLTIHHLLSFVSTWKQDKLKYTQFLSFHDHSHKLLPTHFTVCFAICSLFSLRDVLFLKLNVTITKTFLDIKATTVARYIVFLLFYIIKYNLSYL
jgi:hypothetical protein